MTKLGLLCVTLLLLSLPLRAEDLESEILAERNADIDVANVPSVPGADIEAELLLSNRAFVEQLGRDNYALVDQTGINNYASIQQAGSGASAVIIQSGSGNFAVVQQR